VQYSRKWYNRISAGKKLLASLAIGTITGISIPINGGWQLSLILGWDVTAFCLIVLNWASFFIINETEIPVLANQQDESRLVSFVFIIVAAVLSLLGITFMLGDEGVTERPKWEIAFTLVSVSVSWVLIHTLFTLRYAHLYYIRLKEQPEQKVLGFPNETHPNYIDFAYFAFIIGMTFQVSDVEVKSKRLRRIVLIHGLVSFVFNTFIVALLINIIAGNR
jgi:uncharacterized membrane protein